MRRESSLNVGNEGERSPSIGRTTSGRQSGIERKKGSRRTVCTFHMEVAKTGIRKGRGDSSASDSGTMMSDSPKKL